MSKALEIAEERFAKSEISKEEFESIKASLGTKNTPAPHTQPVSLPPQQEVTNEFKLKKEGWFFWLIPIAVGIPLRWNLPSWDQMSGLSQISIIVAIVCMFVGIAKVALGE